MFLRGNSLAQAGSRTLENSMQQQSLFDLNSSAEASHAKTYQWLDAVLDWLESEADSSSSSCESLPNSLPAGFLSKTSLAFCRQTADATWRWFSTHWRV